MDHWRDYFRNSGTDIWTLIEQAIILAATDHCNEFKMRRSEIAEILFSRNLLHPSSSSQGSSGKEDKTRASISVATTSITTNEVRKSDEKALSVKHNKMERKICDNVSSASISRVTDVTVETRKKGEMKMHEEKLLELQHECGDEITYKELLWIKDTLQERDQLESAILQCLERLETMHLSLDILKTTEIGKQVNCLRKHESNQVRLIVKRLVRSWKGLVDVWVDGGSQISDAAITGSNDGKRGRTEDIFDQCRSDLDKTMAPAANTTNDAKNFSFLNQDSTLTCQSTSVETPEQLFSFLKDVFPETEPVKEDPFSLEPKSRMESTIPLDSKKGKTSCTLVFKVPKKKEIDENAIHLGMEGKDEPINKSNNSSLLVGTKNSMGRSGPERSHDELGDKRISLNNSKLSKKAPAVKVDHNKRKPYNDHKQADNAKKQCKDQRLVDFPEFSKVPLAATAKTKMSSHVPSKYVGGYSGYG